MNAANDTHPAREILEAFGLGKLNHASTEEVNQHLESCADCRLWVAEVPDDDLLGHLRRANATATPAPDQSLPALAEAQDSTARTASDLPSELLTNAQYEILRKLGAGGMGVVYLARNRWMDRQEVLKIISATQVGKASAAERFLREIRTAAALNHDNVVKAHSVLQFGDLLVFAMEYVEGEDLARVVKTRGPLPIADACDYARQVALGLQHAHERGMVHRDVKPSNLILAHKDDRQRVKILDFGLAKASSEKEANRELTGAGKMLGTPDYMAPEQILDASSADIRADVYSLGCTLYHLLTGSAPFHAGSVFGLLQAHQTTEARPIHLIRPEAPATLSAVVARMMAKDPARRYQKPLEVAQALIPFLTPEETPAKSVREKAARTNRGQRFLLAGTALAAVLLTAGVVITIKSPDGTVKTLEVLDGSLITIDTGAKARPSAAWLAKVAALPAEDQVEAVKTRLKELNPNFDGKAAPTIEAGVVTGLEFSTDHVSDLSPVQALTGLRRLACGGTHGKKGALSDLSPLKGLKLASLDFYVSQVTDLSPLAGMPLTSLSCGHSPVTDLSPLKGMKLRALDCNLTKTSDLSPLTGLPLSYLKCSYTRVAKLSPLKDMKLETLHFCATPVTDLSPLENMNLKELMFSYSPVSDLSPLKDMNLTILHMESTRAADLSPLKDMKLTRLHCEDARVTDLSPLRRTLIKELWCDFKPERDAGILRAIKTLEKINDKPVAEVWREVDKKKP